MNFFVKILKSRIKHNISEIENIKKKLERINLIKLFKIDTFDVHLRRCFGIHDFSVLKFRRRQFRCGPFRRRTISAPEPPYFPQNFLHFLYILLLFV